MRTRPPHSPLSDMEIDEATEHGAFFCANRKCLLHVRVTDPAVRGQGNWARLPDGRLVGRGRYGGQMLCDFCGRGLWNASTGDE